VPFQNGGFGEFFRSLQSPRSFLAAYGTRPTHCVGSPVVPFHVLCRSQSFSATSEAVPFHGDFKLTH
jgi:hypothetical protein